MKYILGLVLSILCPILYAGPIDWSVAMTSFPTDQSIGDSGHEKTSGGYVDLMTGNMVFDVPEVTLKGDRGLNFTLSRSYGKVNNGFRAMGNWELESPRLVMLTGASTKLKGDIDGSGICHSNGDYSTGNNYAGSPIYSTSIIDPNYKNEVVSSYVELTNANYLKALALSLSSATIDRKPSTMSNAEYYDNKTQSHNVYLGIREVSFDGTAKVSKDIKNFTDSILSRNKDSINVLSTHLGVLSWTLEQFFNSQNISRVEIIYSGRVKSFRKDSLSTYAFINQVIIPAFNHEVLNSGNVSVRFYNNSGVVQIRNSNNQIIDIMPLVYTSSYVNTLLALMQLKWVGHFIDAPSNEVWSYEPRTTSVTDFTLQSVVDPRQRVISLYLPGQKNITFFPIKDGVTGYPQSARYVSQDNWFISCENSGNDFKVRSPSGVTYLFPIKNRENQTGFPTVFSGQYIAGRVSVYASKVENQYGESYEMSYYKVDNKNQTYQGYNTSSKLFLERVKHQLDGRNTSINDAIVLSYGKYGNGSVITENKNEFDNYSGDVVLLNIKRFVNNKYLIWKSYNYDSGTLAGSSYLNDNLSSNGGNTVGQIQNKQAASVYLKNVEDIVGDKIEYTYGGPYRIVGNHPKSNNGITAQGYMWFYSDITNAKYLKKSSNGLITSTLASWAYSLVDISRPGFVESKSFRVTTSVFSGMGVNPYQVTYGYSRDDGAHEQSTEVTTKDKTTGLSKTYTYIMHAFSGGYAENFLHGLLKSIEIGDRKETFIWTTLSPIGQKTKTTEDNYTDYEDVRLVRLAQKIINHFGEYKTTYSNFDQYGNAQTITSTGMNGTSPVQMPNTSIAYFNSDFANSNVSSGSLPWLIGLPKQRNTGSFNLQTTDYDAQGSIRSDTQAGRIIKYKYETLSFTTCLGNLANFQWSNFVSCMSSYVFGDQHIGLPIEVDVGNGKQITQFAAYQKGIPTRIKLASGGTEVNVVDDFGNITQHTDADNIISKNQYDDAGRLKVETPIVGLAETTINYDGLTITKSISGTSPFSKTEKYNGDGLLIRSEDRASGKTIVNTSRYDAYGNLTFKSNSSLSSTNAGVSSNYDIFDRPLIVNDNGSVVSYCYQSCGDRKGAIAKTTDETGVSESNFLAVGDFSADLKTFVARKGLDGSIFQTTTEFELAILKPKVAVSGNSKQSYTYNTNTTLATEKDNGITGQKVFKYDDTGRIITITHPDASAENITYAPLNDLIGSRTWRGVTTNYIYSGAGRLKSTTNSNTSQVLDRDSYGRVKTSTQTVKGNNTDKSYIVTYGYNALNQLTSIAYPNGKSINLSNQNAFGEVTSIPNVIQSLGYNALHQLTTVQANPDISWGYSYSENGLPSNVSAKSLDKCILNINYGYDALNRIKKITDNCGAVYNATISRYGTGLMSSVDLDQARYQYSYNNDDIISVNITSKGSSVSPAVYTYNYAATTSRLTSITGSKYNFTYDAMGNVINDGIRSLTYDANSRMSSNGSENYIYNSDGLRVRAIRADGITDYVYDLDGNLVYDINHQTNYSKAYVYIAGKLVATLERYPDTNKGFDFVNDFEAAELGVTNLLDSYKDSDGDGLPDYLERFIGSDPNNPDTDGDGHKDGYEYKLLGVKGVLNSNIKPNEPDPNEDIAAWLPPILDLILEDSEGEVI